MAYFPQNDAVQLLSTSITSTGVSSAINTAGFAQISIDLSQSYPNAFEIYIEGSNDQTYWFPLLINNLSEISLTDHIETAGIYFVRSSTQYIRYNVQSILSPTNITLVGRTSVGPDVSALTTAFNPDNPLNVSVQGLAKDSSNALILSDNKLIPLFGEVNSVQIIDCTGYNSISLESVTCAGSITCSDNQQTWFALSGINTVQAGAYVTAIAAASSYNFPCLKRYIKITYTTGGIGSAYLKYQPWNYGNYLTTTLQGTSAVNLTQLSGTTQVTGGLAGTQAIGGASAVGVAPTYNYLGIGGIDSSGLLRRLLTDSIGRLTVSGTVPGANTSGASGGVGAIPGTMQNSPALNVQDTTQLEGQTQIELLAQILLELRILNQQIYDLPFLQNNGIATNPTPPELYRLEQSIFTQ